MIEQPLISVLMPVYNAEPYLREAVASILNQTFRDFELIAVDDGSKDGSPGILRQFEETDERVCVVSRPNTGIVGALNDALRVSRGQYIARMDADDLCRPDRFELQLERMRAEPELVAVGSCGEAIDPDGRPLAPADLPLTHEQIEASHLEGVSAIFHPAVLMRRESLEQVGRYRGGTCPCEDYDLWLRLGEVGRLANLPERLFIWRRTTTGIVARSAPQMRETILRVLSDAHRRRGLTSDLPEVPISTTSTADLYRQWGWQALQNDRAATARRYALRSIWTNPLSVGSWKLFYAAARGY